MGTILDCLKTVDHQRESNHLHDKISPNTFQAQAEFHRGERLLI